MGFKVSRVSGSSVVMASLEDGVTDGVIVRDVDSAFVCENASLVLPVGEAGAEGKGNGTIHGLEGLEYEGTISGGGLNSI